LSDFVLHNHDTLVVLI